MNALKRRAAPTELSVEVAVATFGGTLKRANLENDKLATASSANGLAGAVRRLCSSWVFERIYEVTESL